MHFLPGTIATLASLGLVLGHHVKDDHFPSKQVGPPAPPNLMVPMVIHFDRGNISSSDARVLQNMTFESGRGNLAIMHDPYENIAWIDMDPIDREIDGVSLGRVYVMMENVTGSPRRGWGNYVMADTTVYGKIHNDTKAGFLRMIEFIRALDDDSQPLYQNVMSILSMFRPTQGKKED